jgi:four helix bundle protein
METSKMTPDGLKLRTKGFAVRVIKLVNALPRSLASRVIARQLLRSATSLGANYRAACRDQSRAEFAAKISIVVEEADGSLYWRELVQATGQLKSVVLTDIIKEAGELDAVMPASRKTAKAPEASGNRQSKIGDRQLPEPRSDAA